MSESDQYDAGQQMRAALAGLTPATMLVAGGFMLGVIGSVGPWLTSRYGGSVAGTDDGIGTAIVLISFLGASFVLLQRWVEFRLAALAAGIVVLGIGIYEMVEARHLLHHVAAVSTGWGLYVVVIAGAITVLTLTYEMVIAPTTDDEPPSLVEV